MSAKGHDELLKIPNSISLNEFLHECVEDLLEKPTSNFEYYRNGGIDWTKEDFDRARIYIQNLYRQNVINSNSTLELPKELTSTFQKAIIDCYEIRKKDIFQALAKEFILLKGHNLVDNIDWRLKWILGTSDLATLQEARLQIDLHCSTKHVNKTIRNTVNFEANLEQIDNLIRELGNIQNEFH